MRIDQTSYLFYHLWGNLIPSSSPIFQGWNDIIHFLNSNIPEENAICNRVSHELKWGYILRWNFFARLGPILTKKSLNLELMIALSVINDPLFSLNLELTWALLILFTMLLNICHVFYISCLFLSKYLENVFFQHILEHDLVYYGNFCM